MSSPLPDIFFDMAQKRLEQHPTLKHEWSTGASGKRTLKFPPISPEGFDIEIQAETYGLYPYAGGWHGAPWDANAPGMTSAQICEDCLDFVRSLLSPDSSLDVHYSHERPYRWILRYPLGGQIVSDRVGLLIYNYFGTRSVRTFLNRHLPPREVASFVPAA